MPAAGPKRRLQLGGPGGCGGGVGGPMGGTVGGRSESFSVDPWSLQGTGSCSRICHQRQDAVRVL